MAPSPNTASSQPLPLRIVLGIDGGGTKTAAVAWDAESGSPLVERSISGHAPRSYPTSTNLYMYGHRNNVESVAAALDATIDTVLEHIRSQYRTSAIEIAAVCVGTAGVDATSDRDFQHRAFRRSKHLSDVPLLITMSDVQIVGFCGQKPVRISIIAGTGSNAHGAVYQDGIPGVAVTAGGMDLLLSDDGSAAWIAHEALRQDLVDMQDGHASPLALAIANELEVPSGVGHDDGWRELRTIRENMPKSELAGLAKSVVAGAATAGCQTSRAILRGAGERLAEMATRCFNRLQATSGAKFRPEEVEILLVGGVWQNERVGEAFRKKLVKSSPTISPSSIQFVARPQEGAARCAHLAYLRFKRGEFTDDLASLRTLPPDFTPQHWVNFERLSLRGLDVRFDLANLEGAYFGGADLGGLSFRNAKLHNANFMDAQLNGADLTGADLSRCNLRGANLTGCDVDAIGDLRDAVIDELTYRRSGEGQLAVERWRRRGALLVGGLEAMRPSHVELSFTGRLGDLDRERVEGLLLLPIIRMVRAPERQDEPLEFHPAYDSEKDRTGLSIYHLTNEEYLLLVGVIETLVALIPASSGTAHAEQPFEGGGTPTDSAKKDGGAQPDARPLAQHAVGQEVLSALKVIAERMDGVEVRLREATANEKAGLEEIGRQLAPIYEFAERQSTLQTPDRVAEETLTASVKRHGAGLVSGIVGNYLSDMLKAFLRGFWPGV